jgi:hypothetical protein
MNYWIFQSVIERQDLRVTLQEQKEDTRLASRYRQQMSPNDLVYFWLAGDERIRGIYGWGILLSPPLLSEDGQEYRVRVQYRKRLRSALLAAKIKTTPPLQDLMIFRAPQATNFLLSKEEAQAIADLLDPDERPPI